jgi:glycine/D-amino acid oxidase-like deaminating enzyme
MSKNIQPAFGQVWQSDDPRDVRQFVIMGFVRASNYVLCRNLRTGRLTEIARRRLRPQGKRGYSLVKEAQGGD